MTALLGTPSSVLDMQVAVAKALLADPVYPSLCAGPYDPAPELTPFPYTLFGEHIESSWNSFQRGGREVLFIMHIFSRVPTFFEAYTVLNAMNAVLDGLTMDLELFYNTMLLYERSSKQNDPDGLTRHLIVHYRTKNVAK